MTLWTHVKMGFNYLFNSREHSIKLCYKNTEQGQ